MCSIPSSVGEVAVRVHESESLGLLAGTGWNTSCSLGRVRIETWSPARLELPN